MADIKSSAFDIADLQRLAKRQLPRGIYEFVERGTEDDRAIVNNRTAFDQLAFRPKVLRDVSTRDVGISLFGKRLPSPIIVAPTGVAGLIWHDGDVAIARAAAAIGAPFCLSTASMTPMERVAESTTAPLWFQLYMWPDLSLTRGLVERARAAGYDTLIITVDSAVPSNREYNRRNGFAVPFRVNPRNFWDLARHPRWVLSVIGRYLAASGMPAFENYPEAYRASLSGGRRAKLSLPRNDSLTWADFRELRAMWDGPLIIKGILHPDDANAAVENGADAIVVSNHGGRNLDYALPPLMALPVVVDAVNGRVPVIVDSGIRRGSDVIKALALGATAVMVGRAPLWGLAAAGEQGAAYALELLVEETRRVVGSLGCRSIGEIDRALLCERVFDLAAAMIDTPIPRERLSVI